MSDEVWRMIEALSLAGAEWEALHPAGGAETDVPPDADRLLRRAAELVELAVAGDGGDE